MFIGKYYGLYPKENQPRTLIGRTDVEAPIHWPPDAKSWLIRKDPVAGKDWRQQEKGITEEKIVEWHYQLNGLEFEQALGDGRQRSLACCSPWDSQESSPTPEFKSIHSSMLSFLYIQLSHPYMTTGKTIALTRWKFLLKNILVPSSGITGEGNGNPLQYSCLENPRDREFPGGLPSMGSPRVRHDWSDLAAAAAVE